MGYTKRAGPYENAEICSGATVSFAGRTQKLKTMSLLKFESSGHPNEDHPKEWPSVWDKEVCEGRTMASMPVGLQKKNGKQKRHLCMFRKSLHI